MKSTPLRLGFWADFIKSTGYDHRKTQDDLVDLITKTLHERGHLLGRAGTGTGKSLASVIPALSYAMRNGSEGGPVIVSTATKALQGQYYLKDLPFMAKHFKIPGADDPLSPRAGQKQMKFAILKGKRNYLCLDRMAIPTERIEPSILKKLNKLPRSHEGDVATLGLQRWQENALTISSEDCPGANECIPHALMSGETGAGCYYERAKKKAGESDVLVINHALLASHIKILAATEGAIALLPQWSVLVADECHKLTGYVQGALGWRLSITRLLKWANSCLEGEDLEDFKGLARRFFDEVVTYDPQDKKNEQQIQDRDTLRGQKYLATMAETVDEAWDAWSMASAETRSNDDRKKARQCANLMADLEVAVNPDNRDNFWVELDKQGNKMLYYKPAESKCADFMKEHLWPIAPSILLSATTPTAESMGLPEDTEEFEADSPFDYANQSRLYISSLDGAPPFNADSYERELWQQNRHKEMLSLVAASDGRALLLFTSWKDLNAAHDALAPRLKQAGVKILKQDREAESERDRLAREFKEDEHSVLFGTESFFEGVDIPGRSCQLVLISKMPFPAMIDNTRGGKLDFKTEMLPEMRMKVIQAAGRLIRTHDDRGLVAILDRRMTSKPYGRNILANVSPFNEMTQVRSLGDAMKYLESLEDGE